MQTVIYDGTYQGWLTAVFDIYEHKFGDIFFSTEAAGETVIFSTPHRVITDDVKATRVLKGLEQRLTPDGMKSLYRTFLSEIDKLEDIMLAFARHAFSSSQNIETDLTNPAVLGVAKAAKLVRREAHRMTAFVRFKKTTDELFYAIVEPDCNVLPVITKHFKDRFADQRWLIYDAKRKYGIYYDLDAVTTVTLEFAEAPSSSQIAGILDDREEFFQKLWRRYFSSVNIKARMNMKLHIQHMPKRYWRHLTEKMQDI